MPTVGEKLFTFRSILLHSSPRKKQKIVFHVFYFCFALFLMQKGIHETDLCMWGLGVNSLPERITSMGGKFLWDVSWNLIR